MSKTTQQVCEDCGINGADTSLLYAVLDGNVHPADRQEVRIQGIIGALCRRIEKLEEEKVEWLDWRDKPTPEDAEIEKAGPWNDGDTEIYSEAMRLVEARHSKASLVALVHWLLTRIEKLDAAMTAIRDGMVDYGSPADGLDVVPERIHKIAKEALS